MISLIAALSIVIVAGIAGLRAFANLVFKRRLRACAADAQAHFPRMRITPGELAVFDVEAGIEPRGLALVLPGWQLFDPRGYSRLIAELNDAAYTVLFPFYQEKYFLSDFKGTVRRILDAHVPYWRERVKVLVGHSGGASVAADLFVSERGALAPDRLILLAPGDGSGPNGERPLPGFLLRWKPAAGTQIVLPDHKPVISIITPSDDTVSGNWVADQIDQYFRSISGNLAIVREVISPGHGEVLGHFLAIGGAASYRLPRVLKRLCKTDDYAGYGEGWASSPTKERFWTRFRALLSVEDRRARAAAVAKSDATVFPFAADARAQIV